MANIAPGAKAGQCTMSFGEYLFSESISIQHSRNPVTREPRRCAVSALPMFVLFVMVQLHFLYSVAFTE